jgi:hypothetical protein
MFQFPGLLGYSGLDARWAAPPDLSQPSTPDLLMTPRHPPRALRSLTTPIGPPQLTMNQVKLTCLKERRMDRYDGHFNRSHGTCRHSVSRRGTGFRASFVSVRVL